MGKIYTAQDKLILYINTGSNLSEYSSIHLEGTDPDGNSFSPGSPIVLEDINSGLVSYEVSNSDFTTSGTWTLWIKVNYAGGYVAYGEPFHLNIYDPGT